MDRTRDKVTASPTTVAEHAATATQVVAYLKRHPDFFAEHPEILDLLTPPAARGGTGVVDMQQFMLKLSPTLVPQDTSGVLTVTYACKHQLSAAGTSIPEQHHDIVILGAAAYAMLAYQVPTSDLFDYQDGEMRDRVDERSVPGAWLAAANRALSDFQARLERVKRQRNAGVAAVAQWGDEPIRWQRT